MKNKKLIKRIAVASLACFLAIPTINTVPTQAETLVTIEMLQQEIEQEKKKIEDAKKNLEICKGLKSEKEQYNKTNNTTSGWENAIENYEIAIKDKQANINDIRNGVVMYRYTKEENEQKKKENQEKLVQQAAQKAAEQAEKDRIANTIYKIEVDNAKDFIPHFEGSDTLFAETYKYERADMPGVIFTLRCKKSVSYWSITDIDPHFTIENVRNYTIKSYEDATSKNIEYDSIQDYTFNYLSPFDGIIPLTTGCFQASIGEDPRLATYTGGATSCQKGWNSFKVHAFYKLVKEDGTVLRNAGRPIDSSKDAVAITNYLNSVKGSSMVITFYTDPNYNDELSKAKANAENSIKQWDAQGINPIIEIIQN